jgi:hypothetical protein
VIGTSGRWVDIRKGRMRVNMVMYFIFIYENRMKPVEIVLRREERKRENDGWDNYN